MNHATITNLCQSVVVPVPGFGDVSMKLGAGGEGVAPVEAKTLYIDATDLSTNATFTNIDIGVSVDDTTKGPGLHKGDKHYSSGFLRSAGRKVRHADRRQADRLGDHGGNLQAQWPPHVREARASTSASE